MKKFASILDYSYPFLDPAVWDHEQKLYSYQKDFILRLLNSMYENYQLKQPEAWITDIRIIGSLTTSKWLFTSDMDVHMVVDLAKFIEINMPGTEPKLAYEYLDNTRKEFDRAKILAPMTQHPIEYYFEVPEFITTNTSVVGIYSITQDKWLKEPVIFPADIDFEESKKQVMTEAEALAAQLDGSFGKIDRQIKRIDELELMINAWDGDKQQLFYNKVEEKLKAIEAEILKDLELRQALIDSRHAAQDPMADIEIKFKWLQRFGFFGILTKLKALMLETGGQITVQELPLLKKIVTDSSLKDSFIKEALHKQTLAVDFDDTIAHENEDKSIGEPEEGVKEALTQLKEDGYIIEIYSARANDDKGADEIKQWLDTHEIPYDSILNIEKPIATHYIDNRAIKYTNWKDVVNEVQKSDKTASLIVAKLNQKYWVDPSGQEIAIPNRYSHLSWIIFDILKERIIENNSPEAQEQQARADDKANEMIRSGWMRVTTESDYDFAMEVADINNLPPYIDNFIANHYTGGGVEIDDLDGNYQDVSDPFPSLRKAIYQAKRLRNAAHLFSKRDIVAQTKKVKQGNYSCVMALVPHDLAQEIVAWGVRNVPDEDLYLDGEKFGRELESHITIKYGLLTDDGKHVRRSFNDSKPFKAKLGKVRHFEPPELPFDVLTIEVISDDLQKANAMICDKFDCAEGLVSDEYKPHITIAYMKRGDAKEYVGADEFEGKEIVLDTIIFSPNKGNRTYFSIGTDKESAFILEKINKFASVEQVETSDGARINVLVNPSADELLGLANRAQGHALRGLVDPNTGDLYAWEAYKSIHTPMIFALGLDMNYDKYNGIASKHILHFSGDYVTRMLDFQKEVRDELQSATMPKAAAFLPSLFNAPDNDWQFEEGGDDKEIALNPDSVSDETTWYAPCTEGKPRTKEVWRQFISMFSNLFSKNDTSKIEAAQEIELINIGTFNAPGYGKFKIEVPADLLEQYFNSVTQFNRDLNLGKNINALDKERARIHNALVEFAFNRIAGEGKNYKDFPMVSGDIKFQIANFIDDMVPKEDLIQDTESSLKVSYDKKLEETEKNELGEDQTAHEYAKDFKDLNLIKKPHNTTWDSLTQDGEPSKPTSVTYSPQISNEDNLDQNSPGGYPRRFMGKPKGEWFSNEGEANHILIDMLKNRNAAIEKTTIDITAGSQSASVPDYLIDEWKTDQLHDDISEEPYVNHDQRDYPYGMHDSPENTGYNIGWPKDNSRAVVRLDTLENPAFRLDPFGIGEYNVTYYTAMPASDGIEQMNEE